MSSALHSGILPLIEPTLRHGVIGFRLAKTSYILCVLFGNGFLASAHVAQCMVAHGLVIWLSCKQIGHMIMLNCFMQLLTSDCNKLIFYEMQQL